MTTNILSVDEVTKEFEGGFKLGPVSFAIASGQTMALVGKNGAGKTTLFQLLTGNLDATSGVIKLGHDRVLPETPAIKRRIGYLPQHHQLPAWVTGRELLGYAARLHEMPEPTKVAEDHLDRWGATEYGHKPIASCSHGMQKRIGIGLATMHDPELLILDEPFSGLDLTHIRSLSDLILARAKKGQATLISTHITPYCARLAGTVSMIVAGQVSTLDSWTSLDELARARTLEAEFFRDDSSTTSPC